MEAAEAPFRELAARSGLPEAAQLPAPREEIQDERRAWSPEDTPTALLAHAEGERPRAEQPSHLGRKLLERLVGAWWGPRGKLYRVCDDWTCQQVSVEEETRTMDLAWGASARIVWGRALTLAPEDLSNDDSGALWRWQGGCPEGTPGEIALMWVRHVEEGEQ